MCIGYPAPARSSPIGENYEDPNKFSYIDPSLMKEALGSESEGPSEEARRAAKKARKAEKRARKEEKRAKKGKGRAAAEKPKQSTCHFPVTIAHFRMLAVASDRSLAAAAPGKLIAHYCLEAANI